MSIDLTWQAIDNPAHLRGVGARRREQGFTLIELMIVVAIIAILAGIAFASYEFATIKSRRAAASNCTLELAQFMERYYTTNLKYTDAVLPVTQCRTDLATSYTFGFAGTPDASTYVIAAVPQNRQLAKDTACGTLRLNQAGTKAKSGSAPKVSDCW